ncbi:MAG: hypothetical protein P8166_10060 [Candidatus Thiodiazotropha sp.]
MAKKKVWLTWVPQGEGVAGPEQSLGLLNQVGLGVSGAYWVDDLEKMAWQELAAQLIDSSGPDLWIVAGRKEDFESEQNRYGLSLVSAMVAEERATPWKGICLGIDFMPEQAGLPTLLRPFQCLSGLDSGWPSKVVAAAFMTEATVVSEDFRFNVIAHPMLGQWFEVGPLDESWAGVMLGVAGDSSITHHAIGTRGQLPEKSVLEYPIQGIQAKLGDDEYTAWSVQNSVGTNQSYYVKVEGFPRSLIIGAHPGTDMAEVVCLELM